MLRFVLAFVLASYALLGLEEKLFTGQLDSKGKLSIAYELPLDKAFWLQGYVYFKDSWRPFPLFFQKNLIWADLGPRFAEAPYRIHLWLP
ncbi:MAG: hypothetical protein NZM25_04435 [Leptospiraceae bacterium]|nr:hypothetical protein [Leptospiraceae bacterium]MDW8305738.1 hypothetical protein [Leptospiraceae bacterium]